MKAFVIEENQLAALRKLASRLHTERRMDGDEMRDAGHTLTEIVRICEQVELPEEGAYVEGTSDR